MEAPKVYTYPKNRTLIYPKHMVPVVVTGSLTPVGGFLGGLAGVPGTVLNDVVILDTLKKAGYQFVNGKVTDEYLNKLDIIVTGNILGLERGHARQSGFRLGFEHLATENVEKMCISGLKAINDCALLLTYPGSTFERVVASGTESLSRVPHSVDIRGKVVQKLEGVDSKGKPKVARTYYGHLTAEKKYPLEFDLLLRDEVAYGLSCPLSELIMGTTAERLAQFLEITKLQADTFAEASHINAAAAGILGCYDSYLALVPGTTLLYHEGIRTDLQRLEEIYLNTKFVFAHPDIRQPVVTPSNACPLNDGAASVYMMPEPLAAKEYSKTLGKILAYSHVAVDPSIMGLGPSPAIHQLFAKTSEKLGIADQDVAIINVNEAFAVQVLAVAKDLRQQYGINIEQKLNLDGGSIAVGHPVGSTMVRLVIETLVMLKDRNARYGIASACVGGGMGGAMLLENPDYDPAKPTDGRPAIQRLLEKTGETDKYKVIRRLVSYGGVI